MCLTSACPDMVLAATVQRTPADLHRCWQAASTAHIDESISVAVEAVGSERVDRNLITRKDTGVPVVESDARRESRHILQTPLLVLARGATLGAGDKLTWTLTCAAACHA